MQQVTYPTEVRAQRQYSVAYPCPVIIGSSSNIRNIVDVINAIAPSSIPVLITGETGTGKELVAHAIHKSSGKYSSKLVDINCTSIPQEGIHNELFGHRKGAYTGAWDDRIGLFEAADNGTLFLDEIGDMPSYVQAAVLRALGERRISRFGTTQPKDLDFRVITATNKNLDAEMSSGKFRHDLYERLAGVTIELPPLRDRRSDISELIEYFLYKYAREEKKMARFNSESVELLTSYSWPGNVRQLENFVRRTILLHGIAWEPDNAPTLQLQSAEDMAYSNYLSRLYSEKPLDKDTTKKVLLMSSLNNGDGRAADLIQRTYEPAINHAAANAADHLSDGNWQHSVKVEIPDDITDLKGVLDLIKDMAEREIISKVLGRTQWNRKKASKILGVSHKTILNKITKLGLGR